MSADIDAEDLFENYEERAAILEFEAGMTREAAEAAAMAMVTGEVETVP